MRINRYKRAQKNIAFYQRHFNLGTKNKFFVLADGTFCQSALKHKVNIKEQIDKYFRAEVILCTTACAVMETQKLSILHGALQILKHYKIEKCPHSASSGTSAQDCLYDMVKDGNAGNYFVATQDPELAEKVHALVGVPRLKLYNAITLEDPSDATQKHVEKLSRQCTDLTEDQRKMIMALKKKMNLIEEPKVKRLKKIKGPNPLSCLPSKKKKMLKTPDSDGGEEGEQTVQRMTKAAKRKLRLKKIKEAQSS